MYKRILRKRILKGLVVALALFAVIPVMNAAAKPVAFGPSPAELKYAALPSEITAGIVGKSYGPTAAELKADIVRGQGMNQKYHLGQYAVSSEISSGLQVPSQPQTVAASTGSDFQWNDAWIGAGMFAALLFGAAATLAVRSRHQGGFAH
jgi:hypothetical protein